MTDGTLETIDGRPALRFDRTLAHSVERVWRAVTDPKELERWFPTAADWTPAIGETFDDRALAAQTAAGWEVYLSRLEPHPAGGYVSEEQAHQSWEEVHERYAERFGIDPTPGRRLLAAQRAGQR
jgi:uncharacterized protein YndB with AHSA1/START domain